MGPAPKAQQRPANALAANSMTQSNASPINLGVFLLRPITFYYTIHPMKNDSTPVDDFDATITCEEYYMERDWEDDENDFEDEDEDELEDDDDDEDEDEDEDDDFEDDDEFEDDEWEDMEDDVTDCFDCDGAVSENGFAVLFDMERRGYFA